MTNVHTSSTSITETSTARFIAIADLYIQSVHAMAVATIMEILYICAMRKKRRRNKAFSQEPMISRPHNELPDLYWTSIEVI